VRDQVRDKLPLTFEDLGEQQVKNIARPVRAYRSGNRCCGAVPCHGRTGPARDDADELVDGPDRLLGVSALGGRRPFLGGEIMESQPRIAGHIGGKDGG